MIVADAVALADPDVAVMVAVPFPLAVTSPAAETVATSVSDEPHETVAPAIVVPPASFTVATNVAVSPNDARLMVVGDSVTDVAVCATETVAAAVTEPEVAMIADVPLETAVTNPAAEIVATSVSDELHVTVASAITVPPASFTVGVIVAVSANDVKLTVVGDSSTLDAD